MAEDTTVPAQTEGAGQPASPEPVNLAMLEAAKRAPEPKAAAPAPLPPPPPIEDDGPGMPAVPPIAETTEAAVAPATSEAPEAPSDPVSDLAAMKAFGEAALQGRLSPSDEDRATRLMRDSIKAGNSAPALEAMAKLPWILGVRAAEQSWPALDEAARAALLTDLTALPGDNAARLRLSLSRSLAKNDLPSALRLASLTCGALWNAERGALSPEHSKLIGNVFIGRGKPWVLQLPLDGLPAEEAAPIASCAIFSAFNVNNPPITQLSILRYGATLLGGLHENLLGLVARGVSRWSGKWQGALRKEIGELPPTLASAMKGGDKPDEAAPDEGGAAEEATDVPPPPELEEKLRLANESGDADQIAAATQELNAWRETQRPSSDEQDAQGDGKRGGRRQRGRERNDRPEKKERPAYVSREQAREQSGSREPAREPRESRDSRDSREQGRESRRDDDAPRGGGTFNLPSTLRQIEAQFQILRNELASAQAKLRKGEVRRPDRVSLSVEESNLSPDELRRLILQLEARNAELQSRVDDLLADSEVRAQSMADEGGTDPIAQFRALIALKLQDGYADFIALESGAPDVIVRQHYRGLLREIFAVLLGQGLPLVGDLPPRPPAPMPPPPPPPVDDLTEEDDDEDDLDPSLDEPVEPMPVETLDDTVATDEEAAAAEDAATDEAATAIQEDPRAEDDLRPHEGEVPDEPAPK